MRALLTFVFLLAALPSNAETYALFPSGDDALDQRLNEVLTSNALTLENGATAFLKEHQSVVSCSDDLCRVGMAGSFGADRVVIVSEAASTMKVALHTTDPESLVEAFEMQVNAENKNEKTSQMLRYVLRSKVKPAGAGTLSVNGDEASVVLDGTPIGAVPLENYSLPAGVHLVEVGSYKELIEVKPDALTLVEVVGPQKSNWLAYSAIGVGGLLSAASGGLLVYNFFEAGRISEEIRQGNENKTFNGEDDPEVIRLNGERTFTNVGTVGALLTLTVGLGLTGWGIYALATGENLE